MLWKLPPVTKLFDNYLCIKESWPEENPYLIKDINKCVEECEQIELITKVYLRNNPSQKIIQKISIF